MIYYILEPEVEGNFGRNTIFLDRKARPPLVERFHYELNVWLGDPILETICCYIVTEPLRDQILSLEATGVSFGPVEVSTTYPFTEISRNSELPIFVWLQVLGRAGIDDFGYSPAHTLVVSERILRVLRDAGMKYCDIVVFQSRGYEWVGTKAASQSHLANV
jgi:hypothetical protein